MSPPPSLPAEIIARILDALCQVGHFPFAPAIQPPYKDLLACTLVSRAFGSLATQRLYDDLHVVCKTTSDSPPRSRADSLHLEATLLEQSRLGAHTRTIKIAAMGPTPSEDTRLAQSMAVRCLGSLLRSCPRALGIQLVHFERTSLRRLLGLVLTLRPDVLYLVLRGEGDCDVRRLFEVMGQLLSLRRLALTGNWSDARSQLDAPAWPLTSLELGRDAWTALPLFLAHHSATLMSLELDLSDATDGAASEPISSFINLQSFRVSISHPDVLEALVDRLHPLQHLIRFRLAIACLEESDEIDVNRAKAAPFGDHSLLILPLSLRRMELEIAYLPFAPVLQLVQQPERKECFISWAEDDWSGVEKDIMRRLVDEKDGRRRRYEAGRF